MSVNPKLECRHSSGNLILGDALKGGPHWPVGTVGCSGCTQECRTTDRASSPGPWGNWWTAHAGESFRKASEEEKPGPGTMWVTVPRPDSTAGNSQFLAVETELLRKTFYHTGHILLLSLGLRQVPCLPSDGACSFKVLALC